MNFEARMNHHYRGKSVPEGQILPFNQHPFLREPVAYRTGRVAWR